MARSFVVEADGGSRGNPGPAGYGAVVLDPVTGETLAEAAEYIGHATNNVAEYRGLIAGLRAAKALDPEAVIRVRMDSKLVVEQMSGRWKIKHPDMRPLAAEAKSVLPPGQVTYEWIPREKNKHADRLANEAMDAGKKGLQWEPKAAIVRSELGLGSGSGGGTGEVVDPAPTLAGASQDPAPAAAAAAGWSAAADLGTPTTFVLLRHGETALTPEKRFSGSGGSDPELSEKGRRQAQQAAAAFAARGTVQAVVSSPLARCRQTAEAVATRLGLEVRIDEGLRETDFGVFEGLTFAEARERHPAELDAWLASAKTAPPGGESFAAVARRVALSRDKLLARYAGKTVLLVTHVTPVKTLVRLALGAPPESLFRMELSAASVSAVAYYADGNASVRLLNDTSHLR
ncbi:bifunctional RNase H/acid phosphatase [Streptomyces sp. H10-C2]|uniref:bifunctional RNase H/acid phosphatase n=1 Tax=unclassified Streptomyces TaxID=2593676 RepID=UPI0024B9B6AE|nr:MULTISPECIES: bifunctional RNase H/acid phosphatase [unclassified Streptomyces]MDJ0346574.1 bifunctional RNase H/acid phosphatase [Streptomyces sp. PH10-H1]MDJ0374194.1 bifunctional RNase H/acid phosphatase [Streptomyces sp. H10-C2]